MSEPHFNGPEYQPTFDFSRLSRQHERIRDLMKDGTWRTLDEISNCTGDPAASVSAQLRHLRKERFGSFTIEKRRRGDAGRGLYEYKLFQPQCSGYGWCELHGEHGP